MSKTIDGVIGFVSGTVPATNYIKQINAGGTNHDIAVQNGITFFNGNTEISWDGKQAVEVVIPTLADIVSNPVVFAGTVDANGNITYATGKGPDPQTGYLVYIQAACTFGGQACEAGDMAVCTDVTNNKPTWVVIQGENQISLASNALALGKTAQTAITVEGQDLTLAIDYSDVRDNTKVTKNAVNPLTVANGTVTVDGMSIALAYTSSASQDIATEVSISLPSQLANGDVTISQNVLEASNFTFTSGTLPSAILNAASVSVEATTDISVTGTFVTDITAVGGVSIVPGSASGNPELTFVSGIAASDGTQFVTNVHSETSDDKDKTPAFEIPGAVSVTGLSTFVSGLTDTASDSGDVVTAVTVGTVTVGTGNDLVTGLSGNGSTVLTSVSFGGVEKDTETDWFFSGLTTGSDVVTGVSVGAVSLVADESANAGSPAIVSATVSEHVLSFSTSNFQTPVAISQASTTVETSGFSTAGVKLDSNWTSTPDTLTFGGISQASTTVSYKDILTGTINVSLGSATKYFFDKKAEHTYSAQLSYANLSTTDAVPTTGSPALTNTGITAYIPVDSVVTSISAGTLPSFSVGTATGTLTGSVGTSLSTSNVSWLGVNSEKRNIAGAGSYTLTSDSSAEGIVGTAITVASADTYDLANATATISAGLYVTDVFVDGTAVGVSTNA